MSFDTSAAFRFSARQLDERKRDHPLVSPRFRRGTPFAMRSHKGETPTMQKMSSFAPLLVLLIASGCATAPRSTPPLTAATPAPSQGDTKYVPGHVYRLDFVVTSNNATSPTAGAGGGTFTMNLEERHRGEITTGSNVALVPSGNSRVDVGMKVKAMYNTVGDDILIESSAELSSAESGAPGEPGTIHKVAATGEALVPPGKPTLVASADDPQGHSHYQLMVTATKLR
jgi:hypothetical protein